MKNRQTLSAVLLTTIIVGLAYLSFLIGLNERPGDLLIKPFSNVVANKPASSSDVVNLMKQSAFVSTEERREAEDFPYRLTNTKSSIGKLVRNEKAVLLRNAFIDTSLGTSLEIPKSLLAGDNPETYIAQAKGPLTAAFRRHIATTGGRIISYIPNNAYLTIVGDVKFDDIKPLVEDLFGNWKKGKSLNYSMPQTSNLNDIKISFVDMPNAVQSEIYVGNLMDVSMSNPDFFALKLGNQILGGSSTARLFMNLREDKGFTYGSYSSASTSRYVGTFTATASVRNEVTDSAVTEIINEIYNITSVNVTEAELNAAKEKYVGSFIMSTEQPSTIASFASNIDKFNLPENFYEKYLENFQSVTVEDVKRVINKYVLNDKLRILVVGKGQDVLSRLENLPYEIKYYDKYAKASGKPDYSTPSDVSVESVISKYLEAIGGKDKVNEVNAVSMLAEAEVQGMKLQMVSIQSKPNKQVTMMMMMGNTMMKMVFDGEKGSVSQQGVINSLPEDQVEEMINSTLPFEELGWLSDENVKFNSIEEEDGKTLHVLEVSKNTFVAYDSETGLKYKQTQIADMPDGSKMPQTTYYDDYRLVEGILFPYVIRAPIGPQSLDFNVMNISVNPQVSDSDFVIQN